MTRGRTIVVAVAASLLLAACFLLPGKFVSTLDVKQDGRFTFTYKGEIVVFNPQAMSGPPELERDDPSKPCDGLAPGASLPPPSPSAVALTHPCSAKERADRSAQILKDKAESADRRKKEGEQMAKIIGLDPNDDSSMQAYAAQLQKQAGWRSVTYRGKGVFDVDFAQSGTLDRDFVFPVFPRATTFFPYVIIRVRADRAALVTAPGFSGSPLAALAKGFAAGARPGGATLPGGPSGSFTVTSDIAPLTNNTDDGPVRDGSRTRLKWTVLPGSDKIPEALIPLGQ